jgi:glyoxylase-like metal-dependent hydrolase (beta-lactamase superfamily II)
VTLARGTVGDVEIVALSDGQGARPASWMFPEDSARVLEAYGDLLTADGDVVLNYGSFLLRADGRTVLVDTGNGPERGGPLLDQIAEAGVAPEDVDLLLFTHLHGDHTGWNIDRETGRARFPRARYLVPRLDFDHYTAGGSASVARDIAPLAALGALDLIEGERALTPSLTTLPSPGHTPGHTGIAIVSQGVHALILGDAFVSRISLAQPDWRVAADWDGPTAARTRHALLHRARRDQALVALSHFPAPGLGRFDAGTWVPAT